MRRSFAALFALAALLFAVVALAAGRVQWKSTTLKPRSDNDAWSVEVTFFLNKAPDVALVPMKFEFLPTAYYERSMVDGDKIVDRKVPLVGQREIIESADVGFLDPSNGQIQKRTRFSFKLTRAHGFEAGEYTCTIRDGRNGQIVGTPMRLIFDGENEVIDRRTISFVGDDGKKKQMKKVDKHGEIKDERKPAGADTPEKPAGDDKKAASEDGSEGASGSEGDTGDPDYQVPKSEGAAGKDPWAEGAKSEDEDPPGEIKQKPGGCGCRGARSGGAGAALEALAVGALLVHRRRRRIQLKSRNKLADP
jgi:MYXO-CTERM domain-containing protein